jgi:hypothetical protein
VLSLGVATTAPIMISLLLGMVAHIYNPKYSGSTDLRGSQFETSPGKSECNPISNKQVRYGGAYLEF